MIWEPNVNKPTIYKDSHSDKWFCGEKVGKSSYRDLYYGDNPEEAYSKWKIAQLEAEQIWKSLIIE